MNRRELFKWLGAAAPIGASGLAHSEVKNTGIKPGRCLVVGAGLAGLAAAKALKALGQEVLVLEARDRLGGRIWTSQQWPGVPLDLGASWIHGVRGNPLSGLADGLRAQRLVTHYDKAIGYNAQGRALSDAESARLEQIKKQVQRALRQAQQRGKDVSLREAVQAWGPLRDLSAQDRTLLNFVLSSAYEQEYAGSAESLSAHWFDSAEAFGGEDALFAQGFGVITAHLAAGLDVRLSQAVKAIEWSQAEVRVSTDSAQFVADRVLVTLPLGVLKNGSVRFLPDLPSNKRQAVAKLGMGVLNKCYLRFKHAFWPGDVDWLEHIPAQHGRWTEWVSFKRVADQPVLLGFNAADFGRDIEAWSDEQTVASAMDSLRSMFGAGIPEPVGHQITRWASDPFAGGSYSYNALGSHPEMRDALAAPVEGRLFFAGEASHTQHFATAHGAYLSGLRAAQQMVSA